METNNILIIIPGVCCNTIAFLFKITCVAELRQDFGAVDNEELLRPQMRACFSRVGTRTEKAPRKVFQRWRERYFLYSGDLKTDSNNASLLSGCYRHGLKGCSASITGLQNSPPTYHP